MPIALFTKSQTVVGLGLLLAGCAVYLLVVTGTDFGRHLWNHTLVTKDVVKLIERMSSTPSRSRSANIRSCPSHFCSLT
jgi:hypothetical protein